MESLKPDFYQTLCDSETDTQSSKKRLQRSVKSTGEYFEYCMDRHKNSKVNFVKLRFFSKCEAPLLKKLIQNFTYLLNGQ